MIVVMENILNIDPQRVGKPTWLGRMKDRWQEWQTSRVIKRLIKRRRDEESAMPLLKAGEPAPAFTLPDQYGSRRSLAEYRGHHLVLWWYPKADTPG